MSGRKLMLISHPVFLRLLQRLPTFRHFLMQVLQLLLLLRSKRNGRYQLWVKGGSRVL
jgi:hypothetical protein